MAYGIESGAGVFRTRRLLSFLEWRERRGGDAAKRGGERSEAAAPVRSAAGQVVLRVMRQAEKLG